MGVPILYDGPFQGLLVRTQLDVLQSPATGRKYAPFCPWRSFLIQCKRLSNNQKTRKRVGRVDARPIDPPAVVQIRYFKVDRSTGEEDEVLEYSCVVLKIS